MRTYTLLFSIAAHALVVLAALGVTLLATDVLPMPRRTSEIVVVTARLPRTPADPRRGEAPQSPVAQHLSVDAAPAIPPGDLHLDTGLEMFPDPGAAPDALIGGVPGGDGTVTDIVLPPPPSNVPSPPIRVGSGIQPPQKLHHVAPIYPAVAQAAGVSGVVILDAVIKEDGSVANVRVLRSVPLLDQAAVDAVRQWRFTPTLLNGQPVSVVMSVTVAFTR